MQPEVLSFLTCLLLFGCNQSRRILIDGYAPERFDENGKYYLVTYEDLSGGGVFDGTMEEIGWNQDVILAQVTRLSHGDTNGWYVLNLKNQQIRGPIQDAELETNAVFSGIKVTPPEVVFSVK